MGREIKFRGLSVNGKWHYGNLAIIPKKVDHIEAGSYISNNVGIPFAYQVRPESVGQFTGLLDKNGKEIYEGDVIKMYHNDPTPETGLIMVIGPVIFRNGAFVVSKGFDFVMNKNPLEVIGNIHQNPELLK